MGGELPNTNTGRSLSLSEDGKLMVQGSARGVTLHDYDRLMGWVEVYDFTPILDDNGSAAVHYQAVISSFGNRIAIGSPGNAEKGFDSGSVQIFEMGDDMGTWTQIGRTLTGNQASDKFGFSLDLSDDGVMLIVGSYGGGIAEVFEYQDHLSIWAMTDLLQGNFEDGFGYSVAISGSGTTAIIGAPFANNNSGFARVKDIQNFSFISQVTGQFPNDEYGKSVDISHDGLTVSVGAPGSDSVEIEIYDVVTNSWSRIGSRIEISNEGFGTAVSLSSDGSCIAVGAPLNSFFGPLAGHAYVFEFNALTDTWEEIGEDFFGDEAFDECGAAVAISLNKKRVAVGCPGATTNGGLNAGSVCVYQTQPPTGDDDDFLFPSLIPTTPPSLIPSSTPSSLPTTVPTSSSSIKPSISFHPTNLPSISHAPFFSNMPSKNYPPTLSPTKIRLPTISPMPTISKAPSLRPTDAPSTSVTPSISAMPTEAPSTEPTVTAPPFASDAGTPPTSQLPFSISFILSAVLALTTLGATFFGGVCLGGGGVLGLPICCVAIMDNIYFFQEWWHSVQ